MMFSVILVVRNDEKYIADAINSVLENTYDNWELIIVDDGSTDETVRLINSFSNSRIRKFFLKHVGLGAARNLGIALSRGEYLMFLDSDDLLHCNTLMTLQKEIILNGNDWIQFGWTSLENDGANGTVISKKFSQSTFAAWNKCYKRELIQNIQFTENVLFEDMGFLVHSFKTACNPSFIEDVLYSHRNRENSISRRVLSPTARIDVLQSLRKSMEIIDRDTKEIAIRCVYNHVNRILNESNMKDPTTKEALNKFQEFITEFKLSGWTGSLGTTSMGRVKNNIGYWLVTKQKYRLARVLGISRRTLLKKLVIRVGRGRYYSSVR